MLAIVTSHPIQYQAPLWRELAAAGIKFEVWFLTPHAVEATFDREFGRTFAWDLDLLEGYPHRFLPIEEGWRLDRFRGIRLRGRWHDLFRAHGVTHLWVEGWRFLENWLAVRAAHSEGIRVLLRGETHGMAPESAFRRAWKRPLLHWYFSRVDHFLCIGAANRRFYERHGVEAERLTRAPYCIDNARFAAAAAELAPQRAELRRRWSISPDAYAALFCGKLIKKKRPFDLLEAARISPIVAGRPVHLLYAGDGALAPALREGLAAPGAPRGTVTGFLNQTEIPQAFSAADCLVLPSDYGETWGLVVNEALASGLPAVISDHCGCAEDLGPPQGSQHVYACGDLHALARSLAYVAGHPPNAALIQRIADAHAPKRTAESVQAILDARPDAARD